MLSGATHSSLLEIHPLEHASAPDAEWRSLPEVGTAHAPGHLRSGRMGMGRDCGPFDVARRTARQGAAAEHPDQHAARPAERGMAHADPIAMDELLTRAASEAARESGALESRVSGEAQRRIQRGCSARAVGIERAERA